jgi:hypothetical protein
VDGEGERQKYPYTRSACVVIPQGTDCVRIRVYYFSREWPEWTSEQSEFNDTLQYRVGVPGQPLESGSTSVNQLHSLFGPGPYPGGNYLAFDEHFSLEGHTQDGPAEIGLRATATNVSDSELGSGVAFVVECAEVDLDFSGVPEEDELYPGGLLRLNDDDDNSNGVPDKDDTGPVAGENDLVPVVISLNNPLYPGFVDFSVPSGASKVKVYSQGNRSGPLPGTQYWEPEELPRTVYIEGAAPSTAIRDVQLRARRSSCEDVVKVTAVTPCAVLDMDPNGDGMVSSGPAFEVEIITPDGDPATTEGANATSERSYTSGATFPFATVACAAGDVPDPQKLRWTIQDVGTIRAKWDPHIAGNEYIGTGLTSTAKYTGMPANFNDFGPKTITLTLDGLPGCQDTQVVE